MVKTNSNNIDLFINFGGGWPSGESKILTMISNSLPQSMTRKVVTIHEVPHEYNVSAECISLVHLHKSLILRKLSYPIVLIRLLLLINREKPRLCVGSGLSMSIVLMLAKIITKQNMVIAVHIMPSYYTNNVAKIEKAIQFKLFRLTNTPIIAVSNGVKNEIIEMHHISPDNITVIYNPIDVSSIIEKSSKPIITPPLNEDIPYIILVGRLYWVKAQWHTIRAFAKLRKSMPCHLLICGDGNEKEYLTRLVNELGIADDVTFLGWQDNPYKYMAKSSVFIQSSLSEALPNVIVESMACGCPVIAADCSSGIHELLGDDETCGFITKKMSGVRHAADEPLDEGEQDILKYMEKIIGDSELRGRMSAACRERARQFDLDVGMQKYVELIERMMGD